MEMRRMRQLMLAVLFMFGVPGLSAAHTHLAKSTPAKGEQLTTAPATVDLWFSGKVAAEWSTIEVRDPSGNRVDKKQVTTGDDSKHLKVDLEPLSAGTYAVQWNAISGDGHRVKGSFDFVVQ